MQRFLVAAVLGVWAWTSVGRADVLASNDFSSNPLANPQVQIQGPDAPNFASRFTYNSGAATLTAHFDSTAPTIKLLFPLGRHVTQTDSFTVSTTFTIPTSGFVSPPDFGAAVPSFGLVNSLTTGSIRATTGHFDNTTFQLVEDTQGTAYDLMTMDYFPTQDPTFGGNSISLTTIQSAQNAATFNSRFFFGFASATLPLDQSLTATLNYNALTHLASLNYGGAAPITSDLTGAVFDLDSFAITLWNDPNLAPPPPSDPSGSPVGGNIVFDSFSVQTPEPSSLALLAAGATLLLKRRAPRGVHASACPRRSA